MKAKKAIPIFLSIVGGIGVINTDALAIKATPKAVSIIQEKEKDHKLSKKEIVKETWKCYIPTAVSAMVTIGCIAGSNILSAKQTASVMAAYGILDNTYKNYISEVKHMFGEKTHEDILRNMAVEKAKEVPILADAIMGVIDNSFEGADEEEYLFYIPFGDRYFTSTISKVLLAEYHLNRNFCLRGHTTVNEFYEFLGIEKVEGGDDLAWACYDCDYYWIDFNHIKSEVSEDGLECYVIDMIFHPELVDEDGNPIVK